MVTATGVDKVYDGATTATVTLSDDRVAGDALSPAYGAATFSDKHVGAGKPVTVSGTSVAGADAGNYTFNTTAITNGAITQRALTVTATGSNKPYDGNTTATVTLGDNRVAGDVFTTAYASATFDTAAVGTAKPIGVTGITLSGADAGNYSHNDTASALGDVTAIELTGSFTAASKTYDGTDAATILTRHVSGYVPGDDVTLVGGTATFSDKTVANGKTVTGTGFTIAGATSGNYTLATSTLQTMADTTALSVSGVFTADDRVYDATTGATIASRSLVGALGTDDVVLDGGAADVCGQARRRREACHRNRLRAEWHRRRQLRAPGNDADDGSAITARPLSVNASASDKVFDGNTTASATLSDDRVSGDALTTSFRRPRTSTRRAWREQGRHGRRDCKGWC